MKLLAFAGGKRSGKDSAVKYVYGQILTKNGIIDKFDIDEDGKLFVPSQYEDGVHMGELDIARRDPQFCAYASSVIWPFVKDYYFAFYLKEIILRSFDVSYAQLYGSSDEKNSETKYTWGEAFPEVKAATLKLFEVTKTDKVTARKFVQCFADKMRTVDADCFVRPTIEDIINEQSQVAIIGDCRKKNELDAIKANGGKVILLKRRPEDDKHSVENEMLELPESEFDYVIDNSNMSIPEKNVIIHQVCSDWGYF
jgi:hypothetical protein